MSSFSVSPSCVFFPFLVPSLPSYLAFSLAPFVPWPSSLLVLLLCFSSSLSCSFSPLPPSFSFSFVLVCFCVFSLRLVFSLPSSSLLLFSFRLLFLFGFSWSAHTFLPFRCLSCLLFCFLSFVPSLSLPIVPHACLVRSPSVPFFLFLSLLFVFPFVPGSWFPRFFVFLFCGVPTYHVRITFVACPLFVLWLCILLFVGTYLWRHNTQCAFVALLFPFFVPFLPCPLRACTAPTPSRLGTFFSWYFCGFVFLGDQKLFVGCVCLF